MANSPRIRFRCPIDLAHLESDAADFVCSNGHKFPILGGFADLTYPPSLLPSDDEFRKRYDATASGYEAGLAWLFESFSEDENVVRSSMIDQLRLKPGNHVLEIGCGTGKDTVRIADRVGAGGTVYASDLSSGMLALLAAKREDIDVSLELFVCNAAYLPFGDGSFDATFHFGGLNQFGDIPRALHEMARVTRIGGRVVVGDEGVPPWLREHLFGRVLRHANPLYENKPPLEHLPENARGVGVRWLLGEAFYVIDFTVGEGAPPLNLDLPIPGPRGGTLRSRFRERFGGEEL